MFSWLSFPNFSPSSTTSSSSLFLNATSSNASTTEGIQASAPEEGDIFIIVTDIEDNEETDTESIVSSTTPTCSCCSCSDDFSSPSSSSTSSSSSSSCASTSFTLKRDLKTGFRDWQLVLKLPPTKSSSSFNSLQSSSSSSSSFSSSQYNTNSTSSPPTSPSFFSSILYSNHPNEGLKPSSYLMEPAWSPTLCSKLSPVPTNNSGLNPSTSSVSSLPISSSSSSSSSSFHFSFSSPPPSPSLPLPSLTLLEVLKSQERQHYHREWLLKKHLRNSIPFFSSFSSSGFSSSSSSSYTPELTSNKCLLSLNHTSNLKKQKRKIEKWRSRMNGPHYQRSK